MRRRRQRAVAIFCGALGVIAVVAVGIGVSAAGASSPVPGGPFGLMGSVFADGDALGYVVVGLLGLVLGTAVTALACRLGHGPDKEDREERTS